MPAAQSRLFDYFVPLWKSLEGSHPSTGLSLIAIARKPGEPVNAHAAQVDEAVTA